MRERRDILPFLSAAIICKNEETVIERCLRALLEHVDEVHLCDTGSSDGTLAVVRELQQTYPEVHVHMDYTWKKDFSAARNHANAKCRGVWIISVDCDTVVGVSCDLRAYLTALPDTVGVVEVQNDWNAMRFAFPKIYRNAPDIYYKYRYHNVLHNAGVWASRETEHVCFYEVRCSSSAPARTERMYDQLLYFDRMNMEEPDNARFWFYGARVCMDLGRHAEAIARFESHYERSAWTEEHYVGALYLGRCHMVLKDLDKAAWAWQKAFEFDTQRNEAVCELMELHKAAGNFHTALLWWSCFSQSPPARRLFVETAWTEWRGYDSASLVYWHLGQAEQAAALARRALLGNSCARIEINLNIYQEAAGARSSECAILLTSREDTVKQCLAPGAATLAGRAAAAPESNADTKAIAPPFAIMQTATAPANAALEVP